MRINHKISTIMYLDRWDQSGDIWHNAQPPCCKKTNKQHCMLVDGWWFGLGLLPQDLSTLKLLSCISCNIKIICLPARAGRKLCQQDNDTRHSSKSTAEWIIIIIIIIKVFQVQTSKWMKCSGSNLRGLQRLLWKLCFLLSFYMTVW